ncbi:MAG: PilZ domain-containing protein [Planctomycetota bacterium]
MAHNGPAEVVPFTASGEAMPHLRVRVLGVEDDGSIYLERPGGTSRADGLPPGTPVEIYLIHAATRIKGRSAVLERCRFRLNARTEIDALRFSPVTAIASAQRRACFRLPTAGMSMLVQLRHAAWPEDQAPLKAKVADLSDRGMGITLPVPLTLAQKMKDCDFDAAICLPDEAEPLTVPIRVVRVFETAYRTVTLGCQFEFVSLTQQRHVERAIQQFSVAQQRQQLRRTRGAG